MKTKTNPQRRAGWMLSFCGTLLASTIAVQAAITVTTLNDSGPGSLRQAIADAAPGDTIAFGVTGTITLTSGELAIGKNLTIAGPGAAKLTISGNTAGRVFNVSPCNAAISGLTIADGSTLGGSSQSGAGIKNSATMHLSDCVVSNCTSTFNDGGGGGGIFNGGSLTMERCSITSNRGPNGGGVANWGTLNASDCTICFNSAHTSGGLANYLSASLTNCTISGNEVMVGSPAWGGGGIGNGRSGGTGLYLVNCTVSSNSATSHHAGGILVGYGTVRVRNTIIGGNSAGAEPDVAGNLISEDYNLIQNTNGAAITGVTTHNIYGKDPLLGPLADNGGPTPTHTILPGSPAIDAGSSGGLTTDQRGQPRPFRYPSYPAADDGSDIGAFERSPATLYVWQDSPSPAASYAKWASAAHTIQAAVDAAMDGDTVLVTNGLYATGGRAMVGLMTNRVAIDRAILVQSVNGPATTVIAGTPGPGGGYGTGATRCAYVGQNAALSGFTLTNGYTRDINFYGYHPEETGGGVWSEASGAVINCALVGNHAAIAGGGAYGGNLHNCTIAGNVATFAAAYGGGGAYQATLRNCIVRGNYTAAYGGGMMNSSAHGCLIEGNSSGYYAGGVAGGAVFSSTIRSNSAATAGGVYDTKLYNCLLVGNSAAYARGALGAYSGAYLYNCTVVGNDVRHATITNSIFSASAVFTDESTVDHCFVGGDPKFVDAANGDYRLRWNSPCIDAGADLSATITNDIAGNLRPVDGSGGGIAVFDIGAYEFLPVPPVITNQPITQTIAPNGQVTFTVGDTGNPPPTYQWYFAGSPIPWGTGPSLTITNAGPGQVGCYSVAVTNFAGGFVSAPACLWLSTLKMYAGVNVFGPIGGNCIIQYTSDLNANPIQWTTLTNVTIQTMPQVFIDYGSADQPKRFYRTVPQ